MKSVMKLGILSFLVLAAASGCSHRGGHVGQVQVGPRPSDGFSSIVVEGAVNTKVTVGPAHEVAVTCDDPERVQYVETRIEGTTLIIDTHFPELVFHRNDHCVATVAMPTLVSIATHGSGDVVVGGKGDGLARVESTGSGDVIVASASADGLEIHGSGSGNVRIAALTADHVSARTTGSGEVEVAGKTKTLEAEISGSGNLKARSLVTEDSSVRNKGSADVFIFASHRADVRTNGSGDVVVAGSPAERRCRANGSGDVRWE
jgi:hypothetical protein